MSFNGPNEPSDDSAGVLASAGRINLTEVNCKKMAGRDRWALAGEAVFPFVSAASSRRDSPSGWPMVPYHACHGGCISTPMALSAGEPRIGAAAWIHVRWRIVHMIEPGARVIPRLNERPRHFPLCCGRYNQTAIVLWWYDFSRVERSRKWKREVLGAVLGSPGGLFQGNARLPQEAKSTTFTPYDSLSCCL